MTDIPYTRPAPTMATEFVDKMPVRCRLFFVEVGVVVVVVAVVSGALRTEPCRLLAVRDQIPYPSLAAGDTVSS